MVSDEERQAICAEVARILREERARRGLSMTVLAAKAGLSQQMVSYVERGMRSPGLDTLLRITGALELESWVVLKRAVTGGRKAEGHRR